MAINFGTKEKSPVKLILGLVALAVLVVVCWQVFLKKEKIVDMGINALQEFQEPAKIEIDFGFLKSPSLGRLELGGKIIFPGAQDIPLIPALRWQSVAGAETYIWEVIDNKSLRTVASGQTEETSAVVLEQLSFSTVYLWRVKACDKDKNECGSYSNRFFSTVASSFSAPEIIAPIAKQDNLFGRSNPFIPLYKKVEQEISNVDSKETEKTEE